MERTPRWLALIFVVTLLAACGAGVQVDPGSPTIAAVEPAAGIAGAVITVNGSGLGRAGIVTIGGVQATVSAWSPEIIELTVPDGTTPTWQELVVKVNAGGETSAAFFVGELFEGDPEELAPFLDSLQPGTHVLLPAGTISLEGLELVVDRVHLHGHPDGTTLELGSGGVAILVDHGGSAGLIDLRIDATYLDQRSVHGVGPAQSEVTSVLLQGLEFTGLRAGGELGDGGEGKSHLSIRDSRLTVTGTARFYGTPSIEVENSRMTTGSLGLHVMNGATSVLDSTLIAQAEVAIHAWEGANVSGSTLRANDGNVGVFAYGYLADPTAAVGILIEGSVIEADEVQSNGTPDDETGTVLIKAYAGTVDLVANERIWAHDTVIVESDGLEGWPGTLRAVDNIDVSAGRFIDGVGRRDGVEVSLRALGEGTNLLEVTGNQVRSAGNVYLEMSNAPGDATIRDNGMEALREGTGSIDVFLGHLGKYEITENTLVAQHEVHVRDEFVSGPKRVSFSDNVVSIAGSETPRLLFDAYATTCKFEDNVIAVDDPTEATPSTTFLSCRTVQDGYFQFTVEDNELTLAGSATTLWIEGHGEGYIYVLDNDFTASRGVGVRANEANRMLEHNRITGPQLRVVGTGPTTKVFENFVTGTDVTGPMLYLSGPRNLEAASNVFTALGEPGPNATAIWVQAHGVDMDFSMRGTSFVNLSRALEFRFTDAVVTGSVTATDFDFPIDQAPEAALFVLNDSNASLDLRHNRWGDVTSSGALEDLMQYISVGSNYLDVKFDPVLLP